jgi:ligand-binding sensor domain-containing protein/signal transduction histidine kinase
VSVSILPLVLRVTQAPHSGLLGALVALVVVVPTAARAERLPLKTYGTAEGLASSLILNVATDSRGFVWVSTRDGVSRFDGSRFVNYGVEQGLPVPTVNGVLESHRGGYWIATNGGGVCWLDPETPLTAAGPGGLCRVHRVGESPLSNQVNIVMEDRMGRVWAGTDAGLFVLDDPGGGAFRRVSLATEPGREEEFPVPWLAEDREGSLWIGTRSTTRLLLRRLPDGRVVRYEIPGVEQDAVRVLRAGQDGRVWIAHGHRVLVVRPEAMSDDGRTPVHARAVLAPSEVLELGAAVVCLLQSSDGHLWAGSLRGLLDLSEQPPARYTTAHGMSDDRVRSLAEDRDGNLWIGTSGAGLLKLTRQGLRSYGEADGLPAPAIHALFEDGAGRLHAVSGDWVLSRFDGRRFASVRPQPPGTFHDYGSPVALLDRDGAWWLLSREALGRYLSSRFEALEGRPATALYTARTGLPARQVYRAFQDSRGDLWLAAKDPPGLFRWESASGRFQRYGKDDGIPPGRAAYAFAEDASGSLWIGFYEGGLVRRRDGQFTPVPGAPAGMITALHRDDGGRLWVASNQEGVALVDDAASVHPRLSARYASAQGLASSNVRCLVSDRRGRLYLGTPRGVDRLDPANGGVRHYTTSEGLASAFVTAALRDRDGTLWFGTMQGLSRLAPEDETRPARPQVWIGSVRAGAAQWPVSHLGQAEVTGLTVRPDANELQIDFFGLGLRAGESLRYAYRLEGMEADWNPPTEERTVRYSRLAPGRYRFLVKAVIADGEHDVRPAVVTFDVLPALWQRRSFQALMAALVGVAIYAAHRYRVGHLLALERMRTHIAADLHDEIGSSLSRVAILSEVVRRQIPASEPEPGRRLAEIADTARGLIDALGDIVWAINPQRDDLGSLVRRLREFAGDVLEERGVRFEFQAPAELGDVRLAPEQRRQLFLVLKEALHNVARHSGAGSARLRLELLNHELRAEVRDDGRGFRTDEADGRGHGLESMRARAQRLGGALEVLSAAGDGTRVRLHVPLRGGSTSVLLRWRGR